MLLEMKGWFKNHPIDSLALVCSLIAMLLSWSNWADDKNRDNTALTLNMCWSIYQGQELDSERTVLRNIPNSGIFTEEEDRALGAIYNALNIVSLAWQADRLDEEIARSCFSSEFIDYCAFVDELGRAPITKWSALNKLIMDKKFWISDPPKICKSAAEFF